MAVDTETKRRSVLGMTIISLVIAPLADGTVANVDREHIIGIYAGIAPGGVVAVAASPFRRERRMTGNLGRSEYAGF